MSPIAPRPQDHQNFRWGVLVFISVAFFAACAVPQMTKASVASELAAGLVVTERTTPPRCRCA